MRAPDDDTKKEPIERLAALFAGNAGAHGTHGVPVLQPNGLKWEIKTTALTLREPVTLAHVLRCPYG